MLECPLELSEVKKADLKEQHAKHLPLKLFHVGAHSRMFHGEMYTYSTEDSGDRKQQHNHGAVSYQKARQLVGSVLKSNLVEQSSVVGKSVRFVFYKVATKWSPPAFAS